MECGKYFGTVRAAGKKGGKDCGKGQYTRKPSMGTGQYERKPSMRTGQNRNKKMVEALHIVTLTEEDERHPGSRGLVPYLMKRIHGEDGAEPLYADEDGPDGPIQITQAFATPVDGRVGPRAKFKVPWKGPGLFALFPNGGCGQLKPLVGEYD